MTWIKLDTGFTEDLKVFGLSDRAFRVHVTAMCWAGTTGVDGWFTKEVAKQRFGAKPRDFRELFDQKLWENCEEVEQMCSENCAKGDPKSSQKNAKKCPNILIVNWLSYQRSSNEIKAQRGKATERQRKKRGDCHGVTEPVTDDVAPGDVTAPRVEESKSRVDTSVRFLVKESQLSDAEPVSSSVGKPPADPPPTKPKKPPHPEAGRLCELLATKLVEHEICQTAPKWKPWIADMDRLLRLGGEGWAEKQPIPVEQVEILIEFTCSTSWLGTSGNVRSAKKLRKHWDQLRLDRNRHIAEKNKPKRQWQMSPQERLQAIADVGTDRDPNGRRLTLDEQLDAAVDAGSSLPELEIVAEPVAALPEVAS